MDLSAQFKVFLESQRKPASRITIRNYIADLNQFVRWYEKHTESAFHASAINPESIASYKSYMLGKENGAISSRSFERHLSSLRKFASFAKERSLISHNPFERVEKKRVDPLLFTSFKESLYLSKASSHTIKNYINDLSQFQTWLQKTSPDRFETDPMSLITDQTIVEFREKLTLESGLSTPSINRKLSSLRKYLSFIQNKGAVKLQSSPPSVLVQTNTDEQIMTPTPHMLPPTGEPNPNKKPKTVVVTKQKIYSRFAPLRLAQRLTDLAILGFDHTVVLASAKLIEKAHYIKWTATGKQIFKKTANNRLGFISKLNHQIQIENNHHLDHIINPQLVNIKKDLYSPIKNSLSHLPFHKKAWFHIRNTRPNWYKKYHSYSVVHYFHFAALIVLMSALGFGLYRSFIENPQKDKILAAPPTAPPRILSFQGRLTDTNDNPITTAKDLRFAIYNDSSATGSALLWQETQKLTPDQDGIFSVLLGSSTSISSSVFTDNSTLYLGITVQSDSELSPRQQIATVAFAANAETLQGLLPSTGAGAGTTNVVLALDSSGNLTIGGSANPTFSATGGTFTLSGKTLALNTTAGSNGNVTLTPDGVGLIQLNAPVQNANSNYRNNISTAKGAVEIDDMFAILATSSGQSAFTIEQQSTGPLISASASGVAKFTVSNSGSGYFASTLNVGTTTVTAGGLNVDTGNNIAANIKSSSTETQFQIQNSNTGGRIYTFTSTSNSGGSYSAPANSLAILDGTAGATRFAVNSSGNIAIGAFDPTSFKLQVDGNVGPNADSTYNLGSASLRWNNLYVNNIFGASTGTNGYWQRTQGSVIPANITDDLLLGATSTTSAKFGFINVAGGTPTATISSNFSLQVPTGNSPATTLNILNGGSFNIRTSSLGQGDAGLTSRLFINNNGNVGIGTTSPTAGSLVHISGDAGSQFGALALRVQNAAQDGVTQLLLQNDARTWGIYNGGANGDSLLFVDVTAGTTPIFISSGVTSNFQLFMSSTGNVGLGGSTGPDQQLDVLEGGTGTQLRLTNVDGVRYTDFKVNQVGELAITPSGNEATISANLKVSGYASVAASLAVGYSNVLAGTGNAVFSGNVGIGITSPTAKLDVVGDASVSASLVFGTAGTNTIDILNGDRLDFATSPGGDAGLATKLTLTSEGNLGIGSTAPGFALDVPSGDFRTTNSITRSMQRTIPTTINDEVDIGDFTFTNGGGSIEMSIAVPSAGYAQTKQYKLPIQYNQTNGGWVLAPALSSTGPYNGNDFEVDIRVNAAVTSLRIRRTAGTTAGTAYITIKQEGVGTNTFTASTATSSVAAVYSYFSSSPLTQVAGNVGIGTHSAIATFDVRGSTTASRPIASIAASITPTADMFTITNGSYPVTTANVNALQIHFLGGNAAVESSATRIDLTPGSLTGGTWNGFQLVGNTAGSGVTENGIKFDNITAGAGTENAINIGTGWDNSIFGAGDLTFNATGGQIFLADTNTIAIGGHAGAAYNVISNSGGTPTNPNVTADNDLYVQGDIDIGGTLYVGGTQLSPSALAQYWQLSLGALAPAEITNDLLLGASATSSAIIKLPGIVNKDAFFNLGTGNIGIGTTTPLAKLDVRGAGITTPVASISGQTNAVAALVVDNKVGDIFAASSSGLNRFVISQAGNVGIGTILPGAKLYVDGNIGITAGAANSFIGSSTLNGYNPIDNGGRAGINAAGSFYLNLDSNNDETSNVFQIAKDASTLSGGTALLTVQENGNVGIGTTAPAVKTEISSAGTTLVTGLRVNTVGTPTSGAGGAIELGSSVNSATSFAMAKIGSYAVDGTNGSEDGHFTLSTMRAGTMTEAMRVQNDGNVGIGSTAPSAKLDVNGNANIQGYATASASLAVGYTSVTAGTGNGVFSGNVGIGTTNPGYRLQIADTDTTAATALISRTSTQNLSGTGDTALSLYYTDSSTGTTTTTSRSVISSNYTKSGSGTHTTWNGYNVNVITNLNAGSVADFWGVVNRTQLGGATVTGNLYDFVADAQYGTSGTAVTRAGFHVRNINLGGTQTLTNQYGVLVSDLTGATNNYGLASQVSSGANKYNIYSSGTAQNYFAGNVGIGTTAPAVKTEISSAGTTLVTGLRVNTVGTPTSGAGGAIELGSSVNSATSFAMAKIGSYAVDGTNGSEDGHFTLSTMRAGTMTEAMRVQNDGNVGIGTTAPLATLHVASISAKALVIFDQNNSTQDIFTASAAGVTKFVINNGGNVGIGSISPQAPLDVVGDVYVSSGISLYNTAVSDDTIEAAKFCTGDGETNCVTDFSTLTAGSSYWQLNNKILSPANSTHDLAIGGTATSSAKFQVFALAGAQAAGTASTAGDLTFSANGTQNVNILGSGALNFRTSPGGDAGLTTRVTLSSSGNIGIGSTAPNSPLSIVKTISITDQTGNQFAGPYLTPLFTGSANTASIGTVGMYNAMHTNASKGLYSLTSYGQYTQNVLDDGNAINTMYGGYFSTANNSTTLGIDGSSTNTATTSVALRGDAYNNATGTIGANYGGLFYGYNNSTGNITTNFGINSNAYNGSSGTISTNYGALISGYQDGNSVMTSNYGLYAQAYNNDTSGTITSAFGVRARAYTNVANAGLITTAYGLYSEVATASGTTTTGINTGYGAYISIAQPMNTAAYGLSSNVTGVGSARNYAFYANASGSVTNNYGLYIAAPTNSQAGNYGIYESSNAQNYFAGNVGIGSTIPQAPLDVVGDVYVSSGISLYNTAVSDDTIEAAKFCTGDGETNCVTDFSSFTNYWQRSLGALAPTEITNDLLLGASATSSAIIKLPGIVNKDAFFNLGTGNIGIGTTTPLAKLDVRGTGISTPVASISGTTNAVAALVVDNQVGDLFAASSSGLNRFVISQAGNVGIGTILPSSSPLQVYGGGGSASTIVWGQTSGTNLGILSNSGSNPLIRPWIGTASLLFQTNSATRVTIDSAGNVGIGSTTPQFFTTISANTTGNAGVGIIQNTSGADIFTASASSTTRFVINNNGNVGIALGSIAPVQALDVSGIGMFRNSADLTSTARGIQIIPTTTATGQTNQRLTGYSTSNGFALEGANTSNGTRPAIIQLNGPLGYISFQTNRFNLNAGNESERMRIASDGNVGIGTTAPLATLHVASISAKALVIFDQNNSTQDIFTASAAGVTKFVINNGGNVGIGSISPQAPLDVVGDVYVSSGISLYNTAVSDDTIEAAKFCTGDGETNCVTDFSTVTQYWQRASGAVAPLEITNDLLLGASATSSAIIKLPGIVNKDAFFNLGTGNIGIGTTTPLAKLDVRGAGITTPVASISGQTNAVAALVVDNKVGDLFAASSSGLNRFVVRQNGNVGIGSTLPTARLDIKGIASGAVPLASLSAGISPTADMVTITNGSFPVTTAGISALQINYAGGNAAVEASAARIDLTTGSAGTWNGFRLVGNTAGSGVTENGLKFDNITGGAGTENAINIGTGWDNSILGAGALTITTGTSNSTLTLNNGSTGNIQFFSSSNTITSAGLLTIADDFRVNGNDILDSAGTARVSLGATTTLTNTTTTLSGTATLTATSLATVSLGTSATINAGATGLNLQADGSIDVNIAGGSGSTGCTIANSTGNLTCTGNITSTAGIVGFWQRNLGALAPTNITDDLLIGGSSTTSAKFAVLNQASGTPTASVAGNFIVMPWTNGASQVGGNVGIGTVNPASGKLQVAGGNIVIASGNTSQGYLLGNGQYGFLDFFDNSTNGVRLSGLGPLRLGANTNAAYGASTFSELVRISTNGNVGIGSTAPTALLDIAGNMNTQGYATTSASIAVGYTSTRGGTGNGVFSGNVGIGTSNPSLARLQVGVTGGADSIAANKFVDLDGVTFGDYFFDPAAAYASASVASSLIFQKATSTTHTIDILNGNAFAIRTSPGGEGSSGSLMSERLRVTNLGTIGIGTTSPLATLDLRGVLGTIPIASISGQSAMAGIIIDNKSGDIFTASSSGLSRFTLANNGDIILGNDFINATTSARIRGAIQNFGTGGDLLVDASYGPNGSGLTKFRTTALKATFSNSNSLASTASSSAQSFTSYMPGQLRNRLVIVTITANTTISSITYGGVAMTEIQAGTESGSGRQTYMYYLVNPIPGTQTVSVTFTQNTQAAMTASIFYNVDQTTPIGNTARVTAAGVLTSSVACQLPNDLVIDSIGYSATPSADITGGGKTFIASASADASGNSFGVHTNKVAYSQCDTSPKSVGWSGIGGGTGVTAGTQIAAEINGATSTNAGFTDVFGISNNGNVGIGTSSANDVFEVVGGWARFTGVDGGSMRISGSQNVSGLGGDPGNTKTATIFQAAPSRHLFLDLLNNNQTDMIGFRYRSTRADFADTIGFAMLGNGNVGIGTTAPSTTFEVRGRADGSIPQIRLRRGDQSANYPQYLDLGNYDTNGSQIISYSNTSNAKSLILNATTDSSNTAPSSGQAHIQLQTMGNTELIVRGDTGNVGINSTTASNTLDVSGGIQLDVPAATATFGLCHNTNGAQSNADIIDCSSAPTDIAEFYPSTSDAEPGDLMTLVDNPNGSLKFKAIKTTTSYDQKMIGVVSTIPTGPNGKPLGEKNIPANEYPTALGLSGRVPVKVTLENGPIHVGDWLTSSSIPGVAMKATKASFAIGRAMENYDGSIQVSSGTRDQELKRTQNHITANKNPQDPPTGIGKILMITQSGWQDSAVVIAESGNLNVTGDGFTESSFQAWAGQYKFENKGGFADAVIARLTTGIVNTQRLIVNGTATFLGNVQMQALNVIGNIQAGSINASVVAVNSLTIAGQSLHDYILDVIQNSEFIIQNGSTITSPVANIDQINTNIISPLAGDEVKVQGNLAVKKTNNSNGNLTVEGNASVSGTLAGSDASFSGTLRADRIIANQIEGLDARIASISANSLTASNAAITNIYNVYNTASNSALASSGSGTFVTGDGYSLITSNLYSGVANISSLSANLAYVPNFSADTATINQGLMVFGATSLSDTSVTGQLSIDGSFILANNGINVLGDTLSLQPLRQGNVSFEGDKVVIDTEGNINVEGNATFAQNVTVNGNLSARIISPIPQEDVVIQLPGYDNNQGTLAVDRPGITVKNGTGSAVLKITDMGDIIASGAALAKEFQVVRGVSADTSLSETVATASAGTATIKANKYERTIVSPFVNANSLIYITAATDTNGVTPFIARQTAEDASLGTKGSFTIRIPILQSRDVKVNWWIIN